MSAMKPLYYLINLDLNQLSKNEINLLESMIFSHICEELSKLFKSQHSKYFRLIKCNKREAVVLEASFVQYLIFDILSTEEYSLTGIANYTNIPEDVLYDIVIGINKNPSFIFSKKIIDLHCSIKSGLYQEIINKIIQTSENFFCKKCGT